MSDGVCGRKAGTTEIPAPEAGELRLRLGRSLSLHSLRMTNFGGRPESKSRSTSMSKRIKRQLGNAPKQRG